MNWKRVDKYIEPAGYVPETVADKLKRTQEELGRHSKMALARTIKASVLWCAFGAALGMTGMVYLYEHQLTPKPVVVEIEQSFSGEKSNLEAQIKTLNAKIDANYTQQLQRQKEVHFATTKIEKVNRAMLAATPTSTDRDVEDIRQMVKDLGVTMRRVTP